MASDDGLTRDELLQLVAQLRQSIEDMCSDWKEANRIMNTQATAFGWCFEYEDRMDKYNEHFTVLKMVGRNPTGQRVSVRNAFAARRIIMGHIMSTFERYGIDMPEVAWGGVVRDHTAFDAAHDQLLEMLNQPET